MKTTVVDNKVVIVEGPHDSTTSQGTQEAQGIKKRPRFCPRKKKKSTTPKLHLTMNKRKNASVEEEGFEEEATEKDAAKKKASIEEEAFEEGENGCQKSGNN